MRHTHTSAPLELRSLNTEQKKTNFYVSFIIIIHFAQSCLSILTLHFCIYKLAFSRGPKIGMGSFFKPPF